MINTIWGLMVLLSILYGVFAGTAGLLGGTIIDGAGEAVTLVIKMAGGFILWNGLFGIIEASGAAKTIGLKLKGLLSKVFPNVNRDETMTAITMNLTMNMLGLGNAATPMGLRAMEGLSQEAGDGHSATDAMCIFLVINASSVQLIPTTVMTLRRAAGSMHPEAIVLPTIIATLASTLAGILACLAFKAGGKKR